MWRMDDELVNMNINTEQILNKITERKVIARQGVRWNQFTSFLCTHCQT